MTEKTSNQLLLKAQEVDDEEEAIKQCFAKTGLKAFLCGRLVYVLLPTGFEKSLIRQSRGRGGEPQGCVSGTAPLTNSFSCGVLCELAVTHLTVCLNMIGNVMGKMIVIPIIYGTNITLYQLLTL